MKFDKVTKKDLFVSEPNPSWFGNRANEPSASWWDKFSTNWLQSRFHFSFAEWSNGPSNFGVLRVMNDDQVQAQRGFGTHPHRDMEICTYIIEGQLTHKDSMGTEESLGRGSVQFMTAGTGVMHSEANKSQDSKLRFIQMWLMPRSRGLKPNYGSLPAAEEEHKVRKEGWAHLVTDVRNDKDASPIKINTDANIWVTEFSSGTERKFTLNEGRQAYLLSMEGATSVTGPEGSVDLEQHEALKIIGGGEITVKTEADMAHVLLVEMKENNNSYF